MTVIERTLQPENGFARNEQNGLCIIIAIRNRFRCDTRGYATYGEFYERTSMANDQRD